MIGKNQFVVTQEENLRSYRKNYLPFREKLLETPSLYMSKDTLYFRLRFANPRVSALYNKISNEILAYIDGYGGDERVKQHLYSDRIEYEIYDSVVARLEITERQTVKLYLTLDPSRYTFADKKYIVIDEDSEYGQMHFKMLITVSLKDGNFKDEICIKYIRDMMHEYACKKDFDYSFCDYASFFRRETVVANKQYNDNEGVPREDTMMVITAENLVNVEDNDIIHMEITDDADFDSIKEPEEPVIPEENKFEEIDEILKTYGKGNEDLKVRQRPVALVERNEEVFTGDPLDDKKKKGIINKQKYIWTELTEYGFTFVLLKRLLFYAVTIAISVGIGFLFELKWWGILAVMIFDLLTMPFVVSAYFRNKFEKRRFRDVESYIEQMLYSFRRNGKIISALRDTLVVFPHGAMHNQINRAIAYIRESGKAGSPYEKALSFIEDVFPCRKIRALHRYIIRVEQHGGDYDVGIDALVRDRRLWIDRIDAFRKQYAVTHRDVLISVIFSFAISAFMVHMLPKDAFALSNSIIYQIVCIIFAIVNILVIAVVYSKTVLSIRDGDVDESERMAKKIKWYRSYDKHKEKINGLKQSIVGVAVVVVGILLGNAVLSIFGGLLFLYLGFIQAPLRKRSAYKSICREIEKVFPDWLLELALLLQNDNLHVAIERTISGAPKILKEELQNLADDISTYPTEFTPYINFFADFDIESVHSSMRLLYSIAEHGSEDERYQLSELVERNNKLMDQAETIRNNDRVAAVFMLQFVPSLSSSIKMMADMLLFLITYMSVLI